MRERHLVIVAGAAALALALGACGDRDENPALLSEPAAERLREDLDQLQQAVEDGDCERVEAEIASLNDELANLPSRTSRRLRARLQQGVSELAAQAAEECADNRDAETTETEPETVAPETTETEPPQTTPPAPPQTTPPQTAPPPTTAPAPPQEGDDGGGGGIPAPDGTVVAPGPEGGA